MIDCCDDYLTKKFATTVLGGTLSGMIGLIPTGFLVRYLILNEMPNWSIPVAIFGVEGVCVLGGYVGSFFCSEKVY